jgi:hypothetical protein
MSNNLARSEVAFSNDVCDWLIRKMATANGLLCGNLALGAQDEAGWGKNSPSW